MNALSKFAATAVLLAALATLPGMLIAFRCTVDKMVETATALLAPAAFPQEGSGSSAQ